MSNLVARPLLCGQVKCPLMLSTNLHFSTNDVDFS